MTFDSAVNNLFLAFLSINNDQVYTFDTDFEILSQATTQANRGFFGFGLAERVVSGSQFQLRERFGEPHGVIVFPVSDLSNVDLLLGKSESVAS